MVRVSSLIPSQRLKPSTRVMSVAVQTSPPPEAEAVISAHRSSPIASARTRPTRRGGVTNVTAEIRALVGQLSGAINGFQAENRSMQDSLKPRKKPTDTSSDPPLTGPSPALDGSGIPPVPHPPPQPQLAPELSASQPSANKAQRDFQHILRVEHECIR